MNAIADKYAAEGVGSIFLYTNEAHPGENFLYHTSMEQKFRQAVAICDRLSISHQILVDALDGACHRAYSSNPNMTWVFNRAGTIIYKSDWTDAESVDNALEYFVDVNKRRKEHERLVPFRVERLGYRNADRLTFFNGLKLSEPKAVQEFIDAFGEPPDGFSMDE